MNWITGLIVGLSLIMLSPVWAVEEGDAVAPAVEAEVAAESTDVGNTICPVSGDEIGGMGPGYKMEHNGKIYTLCCEGCVGKFEKDPEKYSKIAEDSVAVASPEAAGHEAPVQY